MANLTTVVGGAIKSKLIEDQTLQALVTEVINGVSTVKIYQDMAAPQAHSPWILMRHLYGGEDNKAPSDNFDVTWLVYAVATDRTTAVTLADLIHDDLNKKNLSYSDRWLDYSTVKAIGPYSAPETVSNIQYWKIGSYFHLRAARS